MNGQSGSGVHFPSVDFCKPAANTPVCCLNHENKVQEVNFIAWPRSRWGVVYDRLLL